MHDTFLFERIADALGNICEENKIDKVRSLKVIVHIYSHVNQSNLSMHLKDKLPEYIGDWTEVIVKRKDIEELTAVIDTVEGDGREKRNKYIK
ncbi:hypothetical protein QBE52_15335 [Clostridiaceae bacterium 35-E11]